MPDSATVEIKGIGKVRLERSYRAKHLNITIRPFQGVRVAVPKGLSFNKAEQIARSKATWILSNLEKAREQEQDHKNFSKEAVGIDRREARKTLVERLSELAEQHGFTYNKVSIRNQTTRWGSCSAKNNISLNIKLTLLPDELRDFIIIHELVHTKVKNHGDNFWKELTRAVPDAKTLAKQVNKYSIRLM